MSRREALIEAGRVRLRPILMTTFALIAGMMPVAIGAGEGADFRAPLGRAVIGGVHHVDAADAAGDPDVLRDPGRLARRARGAVSRPDRSVARPGAIPFPFARAFALAAQIGRRAS